MNKKELVLSRLPLQDNQRIRIYIEYPRPVMGSTRARRYGESVDVTSTVNQLLNEGKIKRVRKYGFGHSGRAGHTFFVAVNGDNGCP